MDESTQSIIEEWMGGGGGSGNSLHVCKASKHSQQERRGRSENLFKKRNGNIYFTFLKDPMWYKISSIASWGLSCPSSLLKHFGKTLACLAQSSLLLNIKVICMRNWKGEKEGGVYPSLPWSKIGLKSMHIIGKWKSRNLQYRPAFWPKVALFKRGQTSL